MSGASGIAIDASWGRDGRRQAVRASMRADRLFPVLWEDSARVVELARAAGHRIVGIEDRGKKAPWEVDLRGDVLLVVGGEADGVAAPILEGCDETVRIPMTGFVPSYNLQAAVAIVAGERLRQDESALQV